jgi:FAD:protein FMN transferase
MHTLTLACHAMATRFEFVLHGRDPVALRAAGEEAIQEIESLEGRLSLFRPASEISRANALAAQRAVKLSPLVFKLLQLAQQLWEESRGTFDVTVAPLLRAWGFLGGAGKWPAEHELKEAREKSGMQLVELDESEQTVRFKRVGVMLDLGAIGKGYAIDGAVEILRDAGVQSGLVHGGTSTAYAIGAPPAAEFWSVIIETPRGRNSELRTDSGNDREEEPAEGLALVKLKDEALSVSAISGKSFEHNGRSYGHILDPRTGEPASSGVLSALVLPSGTEADALSTAILVGGPPLYRELAELRPGMRSLLVSGEPGQYKAVSAGIKLQENARESLQI